MLRLNQNNLEEYLKKTEAEQIYMKKINSINMSFTSLLTSIQSVFSTYDYQLSTIANSLNILNINTSNLRIDVNNISSNLSNLSGSYTLYTSNNNNEINSIKSSINSLISHSNSVNSEISSLWEAISIGNVNYNYWKEFNKPSAETYIKYGDGQTTVLDNEELEYKSYLSNFTLLNPSKLSYVFNSNVLQTDVNHPFNFGGDYSRIGLILPSATEGASTYNQSVPMNLITVTCYSLDVMLKYGWSDFNTNFYIKCLDANMINTGIDADYNLISTNLNATALHFYNYHCNSNNGLWSTWYLNDRVQIADGWNNETHPRVELCRHTYPYTHPSYDNLNRLYITGIDSDHSFAIRANSTSLGSGIGKIAGKNLYMINYTNNVIDVYANKLWLENKSDLNNSYTISFADDFQIKSLTMDNRRNVFVNLPIGLSSKDVSLGGNNLEFMYISCNNPSATYNVSNYDVNTLHFKAPGSISFIGNTMTELSISSYQYANGISLRDNSIQTMYYTDAVSTVLNLDYNTILTMNVYDSGKGFSFGQHFSNNSLSINAPSSATYYSYNNFNAQVELPQGLFKLLDFTAGLVIASAGGSMENCVFKTLSVNAMNGTPPYGPWRYVWANSFELNNAEIFYKNKLEFEQAFFHCPFIQLGHTAVNAAMNNPEYQCSNQLLFVDNAPTTSVNFRLTGNNTSKSIHAKIMEDQKYIISVDIRGWHPSRIIGFDQNYMFKNVASEYSLLPDYKFTAHVDNTADWNNYKMFFDPFNDGQGENRVVFVQG